MSKQQQHPPGTGRAPVNTDAGRRGDVYNFNGAVVAARDTPDVVDETPPTEDGAPKPWSPGSGPGTTSGNHDGRQHSSGQCAEQWLDAMDCRRANAGTLTAISSKDAAAGRSSDPAQTLQPGSTDLCGTFRDEMERGNGRFSFFDNPPLQLPTRPVPQQSPSQSPPPSPPSPQPPEDGMPGKMVAADQMFEGLPADAPAIASGAIGERPDARLAVRSYGGAAGSRRLQDDRTLEVQEVAFGPVNALDAAAGTPPFVDCPQVKKALQKRRDHSPQLSSTGRPQPSSTGRPQPSTSTGRPQPSTPPFPQQQGDEPDWLRRAGLDVGLPPTPASSMHSTPQVTREVTWAEKDAALRKEAVSLSSSPGVGDKPAAVQHATGRPQPASTTGRPQPETIKARIESSRRPQTEDAWSTKANAGWRTPRHTQPGEDWSDSSDSSVDEDERRVAADGQLYTKAEFDDYYGNEADDAWDAAEPERRWDVDRRTSYTQAEFEDEYNDGGAAWEVATPYEYGHDDDDEPERGPYDDDDDEPERGPYDDDDDEPEGGPYDDEWPDYEGPECEQIGAASIAAVAEPPPTDEERRRLLKLIGEPPTATRAMPPPRALPSSSGGPPSTRGGRGARNRRAADRAAIRAANRQNVPAQDGDLPPELPNEPKKPAEVATASTLSPSAQEFVPQSQKQSAYDAEIRHWNEYADSFEQKGPPQSVAEQKRWAAHVEAYTPASCTPKEQRPDDGNVAQRPTPTVAQPTSPDQHLETVPETESHPSDDGNVATQPETPTVADVRPDENKQLVVMQRQLEELQRSVAAMQAAERDPTLPLPERPSAVPTPDDGDVAAPPPLAPEWDSTTTMESLRTIRETAAAILSGSTEMSPPKQNQTERQ